MGRIIGFALAAVLAGCASVDGRGLVPGQSTRDDVERLMGPAAERRTLDDGGSVAYYSRQPYGRQIYAARFGADGRLLALEPRLTQENFARLAAGSTRQDDVRELLGPPFRAWRFDRMQRDVWEYRIDVPQYGLPHALYVQFDPGRVVREVYILIDPDYKDQDGSPRP